MKLIQKTGSKPESANSLKTKQFGLFECPVCLKHVERPLTHGRRNKSCGKRECRKATLKWVAPKSIVLNGRTKKVTRNSLRYFDAFRLWYKRLDKTKLVPSIKTLEDAADMFYVEYETIKLQYPNQPITIALYDQNKLIDKTNTYFTLRSKGTGLTVLENQIISLSKVTRTSKSTVRQLVGSAELTVVEYDAMFSKLVYRKYSHSKDTEYLYLIKANKYIKIGAAKDPKSRLIAISTGCPFKPELVITKQLGKLCYLVERYLHILYEDKCTNGEWFELTEADIEYINSTPNEQLVKNAAEVLSKNKREYVESKRTYNDEYKLSKLRIEAEERYLRACENYEESKRQTREANKKPQIETVHVWDERFEHDRTNQIESTTTHGMSGTRLYKAWQTMKKVYSVCGEWQKFEPFQKVVGNDYNKYDANQIARIYPLVVGVPIGPNNYIIKLKSEHVVKSAVARIVIQLDKEGVKLTEYATVTEAAKAVDGIASKISAVCKGTRKSHAGFVWSYKE